MYANLIIIEFLIQPICGDRSYSIKSKLKQLTYSEFLISILNEEYVRNNFITNRRNGIIRGS